jgi:hypothetical protein
LSFVVSSIFEKFKNCHSLDIMCRTLHERCFPSDQKGWSTFMQGWSLSSLLRGSPK